MIRALEENQMVDVKKAIQISWEIHSYHKQCMMRLLADHDIHFGQPPLLITLKRQGGTGNQNDLAKALNVSPAAITVSLKRMEKAGMVRRVTDPDDLRSNRIELTELGLRAADQSHAILYQITEHLFSGFTQEQFTQFIFLYEQMRDNLSNYKNELDGLEESL